MSNKFIDISEHNTILSFGGIVESDLSGVIMKVTEGTTYIDHAHEVYYDNLVGRVNIGFYHYLTSTSAPESQAQNFWDRIKDKKYQIKPVLDVESDGLRGIAEEYSTRFIDTFKQLSGQDMLIYSGRCYAEENFSADFKNNNIWWIADYSANSIPTIEGCNIIAWQYTEDSRSYAFTTKDLDVSILDNEQLFFLQDSKIEEVQQSNTFDSNILFLQSELNNQGFKDINGNALICDGLVGELTWSACPTLKTGAEGNITKWLQERLNIPDDGIFGEQTRQAVISFQENYSLDGDGIVGKNTWKKLLGV